MSDPDSPKAAARRRRHRGHSRADTGVEAETAATTDDASESSAQAALPKERRFPGRDSERGWRDLAGNSPSQVGVSGAMRARDVARPHPDDLASAERNLVVVRRQWQPPDSTGEASPAETRPARTP